MMLAIVAWSMMVILLVEVSRVLADRVLKRRQEKGREEGRQEERQRLLTELADLSPEERDKRIKELLGEREVA